MRIYFGHAVRLNSIKCLAMADMEVYLICRRMTAPNLKPGITVMTVLGRTLLRSWQGTAILA